jgi:hypothetical protein
MAAASSNAIVNVGRLNAFRLNAIEPGLRRVRASRLTITLDGALLKVREGSLQIHDVINDAPNTCTLTVDAATPPHVGQRLRVVSGVDPQYLLFVGRVQSAVQNHVGRSAVPHPTLEWHCEAIDDTVQSDWLRPFGAWEGVSATNVAYDLITRFMPGFLADGVQLNLPPVTLYLDGSERVNGALRLLAKLIGGYYYFENYVLHLFQGDEPGLSPDDVDGRPGQMLEDPPFAFNYDDAQIRTRCYGKGHSQPTLSAVNAGDTLIPIANAVMFTAGGGKAISEWQRLTYTGTVIGGDGALIGPGVTPAGAPTVVVIAGTGITPGAHNYAYTWVTAAGETLPSPVASITIVGGAIGAPNNASFSVSTGIQFGGPPAGTVMDYRFYISDGAGHLSPPAPGIRITSNGNRPQLNFVTTTDMAGRYVYIYRTDNNGQGWALVTIQGASAGYTQPYPPNQPAGYGQQWTDYTVSFTGGAPAAPVGGDLTQPSAVGVGAIAVGPASVTARRLYRTAAGQTALKFLGILNDNTQTQFGDVGPDGVLGAVAPGVDTSGLQMPAGQVLPGAPTIPVSGTAWARAAGGWAVIGNGQQVIRYTGISGNTITGIPASGAGAIAAAVNYNSTISGAPMLIGVAGLGAALILGAPVNIWVQVDDTSAQAALAARVGGSGIIENLIVDERRGEPSLTAICVADVAMYGYAILTARYTTFDPKSRSGRQVRINLPTIGITNQYLVLQDVTITQGDGPPQFTCIASTVRTSFEDLLRRLVGTLEEGF